MSDAWVGVAGSVIVAVLTLIGVLSSNSRAQAVTDTKLEELTREVREHNGFARRMPVVEEQIRVINHRITDLEKEQKGA
ncbi:MAG: hypothetical protein IJV51_01440 [Oscillospiraceae bacterium]|jgi:hypothetical protein|nr:hypothetical protein [Oscillospiraceae bacterium]